MNRTLDSVVAIESNKYLLSSKVFKVTNGLLIPELMPQPHFSKMVFTRTCPRTVVVYSSSDEVYKLHSCSRLIYK
jgi:hypothetical protein